MSRALLALCLLLGLLSSSQAHMWLRSPVSRGGLNSIGGTSAPCSGLTAGSGTRTTYEAGQNVTFQFRVNQHGPGPFAFALATTGDTFTTTLVSNIPNTVTAGPDGFNGVNVAVTIPNTICSQCSIQLSGMGQNDGSGKWYQCADIAIVAAGSSGVSFPSGVQPSSGPTSGGTTVIVTGTSFGQTTTNQIRCKFDDNVVQGTWISNTQVSCVTPPKNVATTAALEVSIDGGTKFSSTGTVFTFTGSAITPVVTSIDPEYGPPGTHITITGQYFYSSDMICKFGTKTAPATVVSQTQATCTVPTTVTTTVAFEVTVDNSPPSESGLTFGADGSGSAGLNMSWSNMGFALLALLALLFSF